MSVYRQLIAVISGVIIVLTSLWMLVNIYADRTLTKAPITPQDQAQGMLFMLSDASSKTTGQVLAVDGGLHEAFLR